MKGLMPLMLLLAASSTSPGTPWGAPVAWGPGRAAWLDVNAVAELAPSEAGAAALRALDPAAVVLATRPTIRVWQVHGSVAALGPAWVPVYRDTAGTQGHLRVSVGGVVVIFRPGFDPSRWAAENRVILNGSLVESAPGTPSLELAARLAALPGVKLAQPNWWTEARAR